jgi:hypothetical protein
MKKAFYLILFSILGVLFSFIVHAVIEIFYLKYVSHIVWSGGCALPVWLKYGLPILGAIAGFLLGRIGWRIVYVEKRRFQK